MALSDQLNASVQHLFPESYEGEEAFLELVLDDELTVELLGASAAESEADSANLEAEVFSLATDDELHLLEAGVSAVSRVVNTGIPPFRLTAMLAILDQGPPARVFRGSAFLIAPHTFLTAGHNVFFPGANQTGRYASKIIVYPGRDGNFSFGSHSVGSVHVVDGWKMSANPQFDFAVIKVPEPIGNLLGWFKINQSEGPFNSNVAVNGYPVEESDLSQWVGTGMAVSQPPGRLNYAIRTRGGMSGGPVFVPGTLSAVAVHTSGGELGGSGVRFLPPIKALIESWRS